MLYFLLQCNMTQEEALMAIYEGTGGDNWTHAGGWNTTDFYCGWEGVECKRDNVIYLNFSRMGMTGELPDVFDCFSELKGITLEYNNMYTQIPASFCHLENLENLEATHAGFYGNIPECIYTLDDLEYLELAENALSGEIPEDILQMEELRQFDIKCNDFFGELPKTAFMLDEIAEIDIRCNQHLIGTPPVGSEIHFLQGNEECECDRWF